MLTEKLERASLEDFGVFQPDTIDSELAVVRSAFYEPVRTSAKKESNFATQFEIASLIVLCEAGYRNVQHYLWDRNRQIDGTARPGLLRKTRYVEVKWKTEGQLGHKEVSDHVHRLEDFLKTKPSRGIIMTNALEYDNIGLYVGLKRKVHLMDGYDEDSVIFGKKFDFTELITAKDFLVELRYAWVSAVVNDNDKLRVDLRNKINDYRKTTMAKLKVDYFKAKKVYGIYIERLANAIDLSVFKDKRITRRMYMPILKNLGYG